MNLTDVVTLSKSAVVLRKLANGKVVLFVQVPGMAKNDIEAALLDEDACQTLAFLLDNVESMDKGSWNRIDCTGVTAADLQGT